MGGKMFVKEKWAEMMRRRKEKGHEVQWIVKNNIENTYIGGGVVGGLDIL